MMHFIRIILQNILIIPLKFVFILFGAARVKGGYFLTDIPSGRGVIFAANHKSQLDTLLLPASFPLFSKFLPIYFVAIEAEHYNGIPWAKYIYGGFLFWLAGGITFKKGQKNYAVSLAAHEKLLLLGKSLCIFPEGKRHFGEGLAPAHGGIGYLAYATNSIIVPVAIIGTRYMKLKDFFGLKRSLQVEFGKPTSYAELYREAVPSGSLPANDPAAYKLVADRVMNRIGALMPVSTSPGVPTREEVVVN